MSSNAFSDGLLNEMKKNEPSSKQCRQLLQNLYDRLEGVPPEQREGVMSDTLKVQKCFRAIKRRSENKVEWSKLIKATDRLMERLKSLGKDGAEEDRSEPAVSSKAGLPQSTKEYLHRLQHQRKELYKNPPVLPPAKASVESNWVNQPPKRNKSSGQLTFQPGDSATDELVMLLKEFNPNRTPEEVLRGGAFGGTYFRSIKSAVTNSSYNGREVIRETLPPEWMEGLDVSRMLVSSKYRTEVNRFAVKCGGSLGMWESSGWISDVDPYGWFQWYCFFYRGRRSSDDVRQIKRWKGVAGLKGRFRSQLCNKILRAGTHVDDMSISPVIRQTLFHWGLSITDDVLKKHQKRMEAR